MITANLLQVIQHDLSLLSIWPGRTFLKDLSKACLTTSHSQLKLPSTDNVEEPYNTLKAGAIAIAAAKTKPWGQVVAYLYKRHRRLFD